MLSRFERLCPEELAMLLDTFHAALVHHRDIGPLVDPILNLMDDIPPQHLQTFEAGIVRRAGLTRWRQEKRGIFADFFGKSKPNTQLVDDVPGLEYIFLFHSDGFVREKALHKINGPIRSPFIFAAIVWRLNDWVPEVRAAAAACASRLFALTPPDIVASAALGLLARKNSWNRWGDERAILDLQLIRHDVLGLIMSAIQSGNEGGNVRILRTLLLYEAIDAHLETLSKHAKDPIVRAIATQCLIDGKARWMTGKEYRWIDKSMGFRRKENSYADRPVTVAVDIDAVIRRAVDDRSAVVRRAGLTGIIRYRLGTAESKIIAARFVNDRSTSVAEKAAFILNA